MNISMADKALNVLFLCTGNHARSIMAEVLLNAMGHGRFKAYSAGSHPKKFVHPLVLELMEKNRLPTDQVRSKSWTEFAEPGAPRMDFVITVCDDTAGETCPIWPGQPITAHWGIPDPAAVDGSNEEKRKAFFAAHNQINKLISILLSLPLDNLDKLSLQKKLDGIGKR